MERNKFVDVRLQRLSDYPVFLSTVKHGDCPSDYGQIRENVGLFRFWIKKFPLYLVSTHSGTFIIRHPLGNIKRCWISRLLDYRGQFVW